jgi:acetoin utilization protein AcuC
MDLTRALGWLPPKQFRTSPRARAAALTAWHTPEYIAALQAAETSGSVNDATRSRHDLGSASNPVFAEMFRRPATGAGASILAGELLANPGTIYSPGGGTHHGLPDRANGFCYLNDPVFAVLSLRNHGVQKIAYVDIDAHHCDGVEHAFSNDPNTLLISTPEEGRWPRTGLITDRGIGNCFNLPVPRGLNDTEMALILDALILPKLTAFAPEAVILQCGADAVTEDPQSRLSLSNNAHWSVVRALHGFSPRTLVLGGGGYNPWSVGRLWTGVWATLNNIDIPDRLPHEAETVLRALTWERDRRGKTPPEDWFTTLRDAPRTGPIGDDLRSRVADLAARGL